MIDTKSLKETVRQQTDLVKIVTEHVTLRHRGRDLVGLCPFHDDRKPSFYVSPSKQIFKCFACGAGGDIFTFVQLRQKVTFEKALCILADRLGMKPPPSDVQTGSPGTGIADRLKQLRTSWSIRSSRKRQNSLKRVSEQALETEAHESEPDQPLLEDSTSPGKYVEDSAIKWEYRIEVVYVQVDSDLVDHLNAWGRGGWEAFQVERIGLDVLGQKNCRIFLKREICGGGVTFGQFPYPVLSAKADPPEYDPCRPRM